MTWTSGGNELKKGKKREGARRSEKEREATSDKTTWHEKGFSEAKALFRQKLARKWGHAIARG